MVDHEIGFPLDTKDTQESAQPLLGGVEVRLVG